jgi:hypothetical protein
MRPLITLSLLALSSIPLRADLVTNGDFETGNLTGWTVGSAAGWMVVTTASPFVNGPEHGTQFATSLCPGADCISTPTNDLKQTLSTTLGQTYTLSFYYDLGACVFSVSQGFCTFTSSEELQVLWGGSSVFDTGVVTQNSQTDPGWVHVTKTVVASSSSTVLEFNGRDNLIPFGLDNVSVTAPSAAVPEPSSWILLSLILVATGMVALKRRIV